MVTFSSRGRLQTETRTDAAIEITFSSTMTKGSTFTGPVSDGAGGMLAERNDTGVVFDAAERWLLQGQTPTRDGMGCYEFLPGMWLG